MVVRVITAVLLAVLIVVAILALGEFHYRNCIEAATHATPRASQKAIGVSGFGGYGGGDNSGPEDRALRRRLIARCSRSPF